jgi:hypothetical protein
MSERKIGFDTWQLDATKILEDNEKYLVVSAVIASELVQQYSDGYAYKPADELEKMAATANDLVARPIKILEHPGADTNYLLLRAGDAQGRAENFRYVKNLIDPKTNRPMRRGVTADLRWFKDRTPTPIIDAVKNGSMHDVSIGFTFDADATKGEFNGQKYDYVQRNIFLDHVAAPIESGRCPGPICGIGYDANKTVTIENDALLSCPVCKRIKDVGFAVAGNRLYTVYGADVLEVIEGHPLPKFVPEPVQTSLDEDFIKAFTKLNAQLELHH